MPLKLMKAFLWYVRCIDFFGSWPRVVTETESTVLQHDHFISACNAKDKKAKRETTKAGNVNGQGGGGGEYKPAYAGVRGLIICRIPSLFGDRTKQTFSDQNSVSFNTSV